MLKQDGTISFAAELVRLVDTFLAEYEAKQGPLRNDLERGLVISYVLGVMRCDLEALWDSVGQEPVFGALHPRAVLEECASLEASDSADRRALILQELERHDWFHAGASRTP
jgi:hypothetical protein